MVVDSGSSIDKRACPARTSGKCAHCKTCSIMNGWAGAGAFSDGKLSLCEEVGGNITEYMPVEKARELIQYCDDTYLAYGAPEEVFGLGDKFAEQISYQARRENIQLIHCPVRHMGQNIPLKCCGKCIAIWKSSPDLLSWKKLPPRQFCRKRKSDRGAPYKTIRVRKSL